MFVSIRWLYIGCVQLLPARIFKSLGTRKKEVGSQGLEPWTYGLKVVHEPTAFIAYTVKTGKWPNAGNAKNAANGFKSCDTTAVF